MPDFPGYRIELSSGNPREVILGGVPKNHWVSSSLSYRTVKGIDSYLDGGLAVSRNLYTLSENGIKPHKLGHPLASGTTIISEVTIRQSDPSKDELGPYFVIEDPIPSFATPLEEDQEILNAHGFLSKEQMDDKILQTLRFPRKTVRIIRQNNRNTPLRTYQIYEISFDGRVYLPPAKAQDMYNETVSGHSQPLTLKTQRAQQVFEKGDLDH